MERTNNYNDLKPFRFWCQKVLPLVYDDSLSYYELLDKVIDYLNKTMEDVTVLNDDTEALYAAYNQLQSYVNNYFDNLDVQDEINAKLDQMAIDGTLSSLINPQIPGAVSAWLAANVDPVGSAVIVDATLSISGAAADAKVTGDQLTGVKDDITEISDTTINLFSTTNFTHTFNGVSVNGDNNKIILDGTATSNLTMNLTFGGSYIKSINFEDGTKYTVSQKHTGTASNYVYIGGFPDVSAIRIDRDSSQTFEYNSDYPQFKISAANGTVFDNLIIEIQIEKGEVATPIVKSGLEAFDNTARAYIELFKNELNKLNSNRQLIKNGFIFQAQVTGLSPSDCCWIKNRLYVFKYNSNDDHTVFSDVLIYSVDLINNNIILEDTIQQNLGHCNTVSYNEHHDALICGNGGNSTNTQPNEIYIIKKASKKTVFNVNDTDCIRLNVSQLGWGKQLNVCWGDSNRGSYNIAYAFTNYEEGNMSYYDENNVDNFSGQSKRFIKRLVFGLGTTQLPYGTYTQAQSGKLNGTFQIVNEWERDFYTGEANNGSCFYQGKLYENMSKVGAGIYLSIHDFDNFGSELITRKRNIPLYSGATPYNIEFEGIDIDGYGIACIMVYQWIRFYKI